MVGTDRVGVVWAGGALNQKAAGSWVSDSASGLAWDAGATEGWRAREGSGGLVSLHSGQARWWLLCEVSDSALPALVLRAWAW